MNEPIINLTHHKATKDQIENGVCDLDNESMIMLHELLNFDETPDEYSITKRAIKIVNMIPKGYHKALIAPVPWLASSLERQLYANGFQPVYSFSKRSIIENMDPTTGDVIKSSTYKHLGFFNAVRIV